MSSFAGVFPSDLTPHSVIIVDAGNCHK